MQGLSLQGVPVSRPEAAESSLLNKPPFCFLSWFMQPKKLETKRELGSGEESREPEGQFRSWPLAQGSSLGDDSRLAYASRQSI